MVPWAHPSPQPKTASRSMQPFLQGSLTSARDRPTDHATRSVTIDRINVLRCGLIIANFTAHRIGMGSRHIVLVGFWATVCKMVRHVLSVRCLSCLSVTFVHCGTNGWTVQDETCHACRPRPWPHKYYLLTYLCSGATNAVYV